MSDSFCFGRKVNVRPLPTEPVKHNIKTVDDLRRAVMTNPNARRDKLAEEECSKHDPSLEHWDDREAFKAGYDAARADARAEAQKLVEALKQIDCDCSEHIAVEALAEWEGGK